MERSETGQTHGTVEGHGPPDPLEGGAQAAPGRILVRSLSRPGVRGQAGGDSGTVPRPPGECPGAVGGREDPDSGSGLDATGPFHADGVGPGADGIVKTKRDHLFAGDPGGA